MSNETCPHSLCIGGNPFDIYEYCCELPKGHAGEHEAHEKDPSELSVVGAERVAADIEAPEYLITSMTLRWTNGRNRFDRT